MSKLHWEELTNGDILVTEHESRFINDLNVIKICYVTDGRDFFAGVDDRLRFFVNDVSYDLKLCQRPLRFFQYKTARRSLLTMGSDVLHVVGVETEGDHGLFRYAVTVADDRSVVVHCEAIEDGVVVNERSIALSGLRR